MLETKKRVVLNQYYKTYGIRSALFTLSSSEADLIYTVSGYSTSRHVCNLDRLSMWPVSMIQRVKSIMDPQDWYILNYMDDRSGYKRTISESHEARRYNKEINDVIGEPLYIGDMIARGKSQCLSLITKVSAGKLFTLEFYNEGSVYTGYSTQDELKCYKIDDTTATRIINANMTKVSKYKNYMDHTVLDRYGID